jgi:Leishmanolysin/Bacterial Ig-like domain (group 1)
MKRALVALAAAFSLAACSGEATKPPEASNVAISPSSIALDAIGATQTVAAIVVDQHGQPMPEVAITWSSDAAGVTVTPTGTGAASLTTAPQGAIVTAVAPGSAKISASAGGITGSLVVNVVQIPSAMQKAGGDLQAGTVGSTLANQLSVTILDRLGVGVAGRAVTFAVTQGGGTLSSTTVTSGGDGSATTSWTLGTSANVSQEVTASITGSTATAKFTATASAGAPSSATVAAGDNQTAAPAAAVGVAPAVRVTDSFGNPLSGLTVTFAVTGGGGSITGATQTTNASGLATIGSWTLGGAPGTNTLSATVGGTSLPTVAFTANGVPGGGTTVAINGGDNQGAMVSTAVPIAPSIVLRDNAGNPLSGVSVTFAVTDGGGSLTGGTTTTNASGIATVGSWTLGSSAGPNALTATVSGSSIAGNPVVISATSCAGGGSGFKITLCFITPMTPAQRTVFEDAAARWGSLVTGDLPDFVANFATGFCGTNSPRVSLTIDDLLIFARVEAIDGAGGVLGSAGWCARRAGGLPIIGTMRFDSADLAQLEANGKLAAVILHEMGHVLGIGSMWSQVGLLQNASPVGGPPLDTYFSGPSAIVGFDAIGGTTYTGGQKVPVENQFGSGTINAHWRESVLANELMTGFIGSTNPLSVLTVRSLEDLGYTVNTAGADPFFLTLTLRAESAEQLTPLGDDVYRGPGYSVDTRGRIVRIR